MNHFGFRDATGKILFSLKDCSITVNQPNVVGNILEEWLAQWMTDHNIEHIHNKAQESPDFWLNPENLYDDWLEVKSFTGSPNFDIAAYRSFISLIVEKPYKLQSSYLLIKYVMENGIVRIENCWLKKVWEICSSSTKWALKVQDKRGVINNIRPATWYSDRTDFKPFNCLEDFIAALEETIYRYHDTHHLADNWERRLVDSYEKFYGVRLRIPRWMDIKEQYERNR